ncbi:MAG: hypothetical protein M0Q24_10620 [Sulfurimonas sp.]|uniref:hypothetical protein n=1 Tax=Sulfurimonas sp. TaxID=2022749 RepID=UPI0025FBAEFC|nr:hypothetical protein [Sulfurimonas sp.]MCK9492531.1 hypothetical protein [Sulfurimonas sp.]
MANLKGLTFEKQIKNAKIRIEARGQSRHNKQDLHLTHSNSLALKRDYYLKSFTEYVTSLKHNEAKLNNYMNNKIISKFLKYKTATLSQKSAINFTRGFSALTDALKNSGVTIIIDKSVFDTHVNFIKKNNEDNQKTENRDIQNIQEVIRELNHIHPSFAALATLQSSLGIRVSEAIELLQNPQIYIKQDNMIHGLVGKGNHKYEPKPLANELIEILKNSETVNYQSYQNALKSMNITSHDMRYTYVKNRIEQLLKSKNYKEALLIVSKEINHHRSKITEYYLSRTSFK